MKRKLSLLLTALCLAVAVVKCETFFEVDENGDEYEVKKFNIQGRQLNDERPQCVVTRRKRSTVGISPGDDSNETDEADYRAYSQAQAVLFYSPPIANEDDDDDNDDDGDLYEEEEQEINDDNKQGNASISPNVYTDEDIDSEEDDNDDSDDDGDNNINGDDNNDDEPNTIEIIHVPHFSVIPQHQGHVASSASSVFAAAPPSSSYTSANINGIEVVHGHKPPRVNSQTHAVFELLPVNQQSNQEGVVIGHEGQVVQVSSANIEAAGGSDNDDDFHYNEEINPVTTTAIWSTGDGDYYGATRPSKEIKRPLKNRISMTKKNKKKKKQNRIKFTNKNKVNQRQPTRTKNKKINRRPISTRHPNRNGGRPVNKRKITGLRKGSRNKKKTTTLKRRKSDSQKNKNRKRKKPNKQHKETDRNIITSSPISDDSDDNKLYGSSNRNQFRDKRKNKNSNANRNEIAKKQKNHNNVDIVDQGSNTFTRTMTMTQTDDTNKNRDVNCIYINKDPPPTTARPFWNVLGRTANGVPHPSGRYGNRKRVNMRILD